MSEVESAMRQMDMLIDLNGDRISADDMVGSGTTGVVVRAGDHHVRKIPKIWRPGEPSSEEQRRFLYYVSDGNKCSFELEVQAYARLMPSRHLVDAKICSDGIHMERLPYDLTSYLTDRPEPSIDIKAFWIEDMLLAVQHAHSKKVIIDDIAMRNFLLTEDLGLKMIDLGQCTIFPEDTDMATACDDTGMNVSTDIFHIGCAVYSVATWTDFEYNLFSHDMIWPEVSDLPDLHAVLVGDLIRKCWTRSFVDMEAVIAAWRKLKNEGLGDSRNSLT